MTASIIETLRTGEPATKRRHAALELGTIKESGLVPVLVEALRVETDGRVREDITWAIVQHADEAEEALRAMTASDDPSDRFSGAHVISKIGDPKYFEAVLPLVLDEHKDTALKAYRAAVNTGGAKAVDTLAQRLGHGDDWQRDALSDAFRKLHADGVPALVEALKSDDADVRDHAAETLGYLGEDAAGAVDALEAAGADDDPRVSLAAVSSLGQIGEAAAGALGRIAEGDDATLAALAKRHLGN